MTETKAEFSRAANDSPRSGNSEYVAPLAWCVIVVITVAAATWLALSP